jgi:hypothetical protein
MYSFSDCAYIFYYYKPGIDEARKNHANLIFIAVYNTALSILKLLNKGHHVRGGVSFGDAYFDDIGFFGPAVEKAYFVESKLAVYPRLMFDHDTGEKVFEWEHNPENLDSGLLDFFSATPFLTEHDGTGYFTNVFFELQKHGFIDLEDERLDLNTIRSNILASAANERTKNAGDEVVLTKLNWIEHYVRSKNLLLRPDKGAVAINTIVKR